MKEWRIEDLLNECETLQRHPYDYDFGRMPEGICNGHKIRPCQYSLAAVIIDNCIINMGVINEKYPLGSVAFCWGGSPENHTAREYIKSILERSAK